MQPNYYLFSVPHKHCGNDSSSTCNTGFLIRKLFTHSYLPLFLISPLLNHLPLLSSFLALKYPYLISIAILCHPSFLNHSPFFLKTNSFLSFAATTPRKFIITGDFNIHHHHPTDHLTSQFNFLSVLSSFNLSQHVNFPTHNKSYILDLVITSSDSSLAPSLSSINGAF